MKLDKESFQRNRFWWLLGGFAPLWLIALCVVAFGSSTKDAQSKFDSSKKNVAGLNQFKNNEFVKAINVKKDELNRRMVRAWERGYDEQNYPEGQYNPLINWPVNDSDPLGNYPKYFGTAAFLDDAKLDNGAAAAPKPTEANPTQDPNAAVDPKKAEEDKERTLIRRQWPKMYRRELNQFENLASPAYYNGGMSAIVKPIEWVKNFSATAEEIWYAQEDLCVRRELLNMIHDAADSVAVFHDLDQFSRIESLTELPPTGPFQFHNLNWQAELRYTDKAEEAPKPEGAEGASAPAVAPAPSAPAAAGPAVDEGQKQPEKKKCYLSPDSKLTFLNSDRRTGDQAKVNLQIELRQVYVAKDEVTKGGKVEAVRKPVRVAKKLDVKGNALQTNQTVTLKDLGITKAVELTGFDLEKAPIELWLVKDGGDVLPQGVAQRLRLQNGFWYLELLFDRGPNNRGLVLRNTSTLTNRHIGRRSLPLYNVEFTVRRTASQDKESGARLLFQGEPVAWNGRVQLKDIGMKKPEPLPSFKLGELLDVRQVLTWQTAPVKRIDQLALAYNSSRTADHDLKRHSRVVVPETPPGGQPPAPPTGPPSTSGVNAPGGEHGGNGAAAPSGDVTEVNGLNRQRYVSLSDPVRRMPVGVVLIIDQAYLQEVMAQFTPTNSRLRFHPTQVIWEHAPSIPPDKVPETTSLSAPGGNPPGAGNLAKGQFPGSGGADKGEAMIGGAGGSKGPPGFGGPPPGMGMFGGPPSGKGGTPGTGGGAGAPFLPGVPGGASQSTTGGDEEEGDANLVELQIYGLATLFERPPEPKPAEGEKTDAEKPVNPATGPNATTPPAVAPATTTPEAAPPTPPVPAPAPKAPGDDK